jgi:glycosyltransferase involved in cell wall biosynthesis
MHILLIHQVFVRPDDPGGTRHYELAQWLVRSGHRVTILASPYSYQTGLRVSHQKREVLEPGLEVVRCDALGGVHRSFLYRSLGFLSFMVSSFLEGLRQPNVDIVWGTSPPLPQVATAWLLARMKRAKFLFEVRDLWPAFAIQVGVLRNPAFILLSLALEKFLYRRADRMVVNSPGFLPHLHSKGVAAEKISIVLNGVDPNMFDPSADGKEFRAVNSLTGKFVALYAGAHGLSNDLRVVLDAANILREDPRMAFVFVGDGKEKPTLALYAAEQRLPNVRFLPPVPKTGMVGVLAGCDCGIAILKPIPLYETTYPNKVFDYMAAGRPVLLAINGVIRDVVEKAGAGICVSPGDAQAIAAALLRLADHPEERRAMGERGRVCIEHDFRREELARQMERVMVEMVTPTRKDSVSLNMG